MKSNFLPVFNSTSSMHRVFGDSVECTDIQKQPNVLGRVLMSRNCAGPLLDGIVTIRVRSWYWNPTYAPQGTVTKRFECYYNGTLVDYSLDRLLILKTFRWLSEKGQINKSK